MSSEKPTPSPSPQSPSQPWPPPWVRLSVIFAAIGVVAWILLFPTTSLQIITVLALFSLVGGLLGVTLPKFPKG